MGYLNVLLRKVRAGSSPGSLCMSGKKNPLCETRAFKEILGDVSEQSYRGPGHECTKDAKVESENQSVKQLRDYIFHLQVFLCL